MTRAPLHHVFWRGWGPGVAQGSEVYLYANRVSLPLSETVRDYMLLGCISKPYRAVSSSIASSRA